MRAQVYVCAGHIILLYTQSPHCIEKRALKLYIDCALKLHLILMSRATDYASSN